jgi:murein DD-endopeptidase MepM/ murein hydrolase activator NlpD
LESNVHAVADGVVTRSGKRKDFGNLIEVSHGGGYVTRYAHNERNLVKVGDRVSKDQVIAVLGTTGHSTGPHVHFEVLQNGNNVNPSTYLQARR